MLSYQFYNLVHIIGLALLMVALGGLALTAAGAAGHRSPTGPERKRLAMILHGVGAFLILLGGFGMLARIGIIHGGAWPGWLWGKLVIWAVLGATVILPWRFPGTAKPLMFVVPALAGLAAFFAIYKPF